MSDYAKLTLSFRQEASDGGPVSGEISLPSSASSVDVFEALRTLMLMIGFVSVTVDELFGDRH